MDKMGLQYYHSSECGEEDRDWLGGRRYATHISAVTFQPNCVVWVLGVGTPKF